MRMTGHQNSLSSGIFSTQKNGQLHEVCSCIIEWYISRLLKNTYTRWIMNILINIDIDYFHYWLRLAISIFLRNIHWILSFLHFSIVSQWSRLSSNRQPFRLKADRRPASHWQKVRALATRYNALYCTTATVAMRMSQPARAISVISATT
jgi:hypothetical protein